MGEVPVEQQVRKTMHQRPRRGRHELRTRQVLESLDQRLVSALGRAAQLRVLGHRQQAAEHQPEALRLL